MALNVNLFRTPKQYWQGKPTCNRAGLHLSVAWKKKIGSVAWTSLSDGTLPSHHVFFSSLFTARLHITILEPGIGYRISFFVYNKQKVNNSHKRNEKCITEVIQKGQSMVHSNSEVKDTTINSYINQDTKRWWLTWLLNDRDPSLLITPTTIITSLLLFFISLQSGQEWA